MLSNGNYIFHAAQQHQNSWTDRIFSQGMLNKVSVSGTSFMKFVFTFYGLLIYTFVHYCSGAGAGNLLKEGGMFWSLLMIVSFFLQAADTVLKVINVYNVCCIFPTFKLFLYSYTVLFILCRKLSFWIHPEN